MASLGHVAVGMAAARVYQGGRVPPASSMAWWSALSLLPDVDVIGFALGVHYGDPWGHRGATHSLTFSIAVGVIVGVAAGRFNRPAVRTALVASAVLVSHALLDTMTDGGLGCALLWPFDLTRYFAPWRPIPVAPIGLGMFSAFGAMVVLWELVFFAPAVLFAVRPRALGKTHVTLLLALWLGAVTLIAYSETTRDAVVGFLLRDDTSYTQGFSEAAFRTITPGQSESRVRSLLGPPFAEHWFYTPADPRPPDERPIPTQHACLVIRFEAEVVASVYDAAACTVRGVGIGLSALDVQARLGSPSESCWQYSRSPGGTGHRGRFVCFSNGRVQRILRERQ
jgi:inner membrane protein